MGKLEETPWLHLTSQFHEHGTAYITATREGLLELRGAIDAALTGGDADASVYATDGEAYNVRIRLSNTVAGLGEPVYFETIARNAYHSELRLYEHIIKDRRRQALSTPTTKPRSAE